MSSPYNNDKDDLEITTQLISDHPIETDEIIEAVLKSWREIFKSTVGPLKIGIDIFPSPQVIGNYLHELIPYYLLEGKPNYYRTGRTKLEKDIVYEPDSKYSVEIKTSSHKNTIFANRSYAIPQEESSGKKNKNGYYIAVNFQKFARKDGKQKPIEYLADGNLKYPAITQIQFGFLENTDWIAQKSETGQQAYLSPNAKAKKLIRIYPS